MRGANDRHRSVSASARRNGATPGGWGVVTDTGTGKRPDGRVGFVECVVGQTVVMVPVAYYVKLCRGWAARQRASGTDASQDLNSRSVGG